MGDRGLPGEQKAELKQRVFGLIKFRGWLSHCGGWECSKKPDLFPVFCHIWRGYLELVMDGTSEPYPSVSICCSISSNTRSHSFAGTLQLPTCLCPPPPYFNINLPTSVLLVRFNILWPHENTTLVFDSSQVSLISIFWSGWLAKTMNRLPQ